MAHAHLARTLADLEALPVFKHGETAGGLVVDLDRAVRIIEGMSHESWAKIFRSDVLMLMATVIDGRAPGLVAQLRADVIKGLKRALAETSS